MKIYLHGGPSDFPESLRIHSVDAAADKHTVLFGNGREHFIVTDETLECDGDHARVYQWSYHTAIAE